MSNPEILSKNIRCEGKRVKLYNLRVRWGDTYFERDLVSFGESVAIVPLTSSQEIILLKQWRSAVMDWVTEIPAGRVEPNESPEEAALRELKEETGYGAGKLLKLASVRVSPGYSDELMHLYLALELREGNASPEEGEIITIIKKPLHRVIDEILSGRINDLKTVAGILLVNKKLNEQR